MAISVNMLTTSVMRQGSGEASSRSQPAGVHRSRPSGPTIDPPASTQGSTIARVLREQLEPGIGTAAQIHALRRPGSPRELFAALDRDRVPAMARSHHVGVVPRVPATDAAVEPVRGGSESDVRHAGQYAELWRDRRPGQRVVRDLVVLEAGGGEQLVRE